jgi:uncharacterized surface protein with fasciclin (FAS1) repeats
MPKFTLHKSATATLNAVLISTGLLFSMSTQAQNSTPTSSPAPTASPTSMPTVTPTTVPGGTTQPGTTTAPTGKTIASVASGNKNFTTLVRLLKAADLVGTLSGTESYTVFAPTNAAFNKVPRATLANLLKPENKAQLQKVLTYHVVPGAVTSSALKSGNVATVEGSNVNVRVSGKRVRVNGANVIQADVKASNGVIHAIDTVLLPPTTSKK